MIPLFTYRLIRISKTRHCPVCQVSQVADGIYCGKCGRRLNTDTEAMSEVAGTSKPTSAILTKAAQRQIDFKDILSVLLLITSCLLWGTSLNSFHLNKMNDLGLVSIMPAQTIIALVLLSLSFCWILLRPRSQVFTLLILLHVAALILMLYGITALIEEQPRFAIVYRHAGYTEFIMRTQTVNPNLDAYFNWPTFFILTAFITQIAGYHTLLSYAAWATAFYNVIYCWPLYAFLETATKDKRIIWLAIWLFYITNWIGQDYISPQGLNFFLYLSILAIVLKWFKIQRPAAPETGSAEQNRTQFHTKRRRFIAYLHAPDDLTQSTTRNQKLLLLAAITAIFGFITTSHPLTPFFVLASLLALTIFRRSGPFWLPLLLGILTVTWMLLMTQTYLAGHMADVLGDTGHLGNVFSQNVTTRLQGNPEHTFISAFRIGMTLFLWLLAGIGIYRRLRQGHHDLSYIVLAIAPFPLMLLQAYGGEMLMRVYLFISPSVVFFTASLFFDSNSHRQESGLNSSRFPWKKLAMVVITLLFVGGFLFTRYGNENMDYVTTPELNGVLYMYQHAPNNAMLISIWDGTPWQLEGYEKYNLITLNEDIPNFYDRTDARTEINTLVNFINKQSPPATYLIISRTQIATAESQGISQQTIQQFERALTDSGHFTDIYHNQDAHIFQYKQPVQVKK